MTESAPPVDIELVLPLHNQLASTLRVITASLAADAQFSVDEIDDLRLAISEVFSLLVDASPDGRARIVFSVDAAEVGVTIEQVDTSAPIALDDLAANILTSVLDEFSVVGNAVRLVKRGVETASVRPG